MTKALEAEIAELDKEEEAATESTEEVTEEGTEETETPTETEEETVKEAEENQEEPTDDEKQEKQDQYHARQKAKREDQAKRQEEVQTQESLEDEGDPDEMEAMKAQMAQLTHIARRQQYQTNIKQAEKELNGLEVEFKEAFTDYDEVVNDALELTKMRLVADGVPSGEADDYLREKKVLIADEAAARGEDPVEAVYKEGKAIISVFDAYAEKKGYAVNGKPKTNLQTIRELNKPNAMTGGAGRGATAAKTTFDDLGDDDLEEIRNTSIWDVNK